MKKVRIFHQNHGLTPLENFRFFGHIKYIVLLSRKASFLSRTPANIFFGAYFQEKQTMKKGWIFDQNHLLTPLENFRFFGHIRYIFLWSRKASFLSRTSPNIISGPFFHQNQTMKKVQIFDQNHGLHIRYIFLSSRKTSFLSRTYPNIICGPIFNKKTNHDESLIFRPKSWVKPFGKFPIFWTYKIHIFIV